MAASAQRNYWLLKSEPDSHVLDGIDVSYPFERLATEKDSTGLFNGVRNFVARNNLRDKLMPGDLCFFYHSSCKIPGIAGVVKVVRRAYPDDDAKNPKHPFYDAKHTDEKPRWYCLDIQHVRPMKRYISLQELRGYQESDLRDMTLLRVPRLSVQPVSEAEWKFILSLEDTVAPVLSKPKPAPASEAPAATTKRKRQKSKST
jgi:predicted RNA-binding protein with PUA-like domain